jgi:electron transfer flavoprotein alpha subunit
MSVLVYIENTSGQFKKSAFEALSYARALADQMQTSLLTLSIGQVTSAVLEQLGQYGAEQVVQVQQDQLNQFVNQAYAAVIAEVAKDKEASVVVLSNSFSGKGLAPRVAAKLGASLGENVMGLPQMADSKLTVTKTAFSGKAIADVSLNSPIKVLSIKPNSFGLKSNPKTIQLESFSPTLSNEAFGTVIQEIVQSTDTISLPEAEIVVSAGRGMKGPENWAMIEELASVLGAATACSKPVSDAGWRPHAEHVGQTGIVISPKLYIAIGISGAIQHLAGVSSSKTIVVINKDPEAPFFKVADYGIVGDAFDVVPRLIAAIKSHQGN